GPVTEFSLRPDEKPASLLISPSLPSVITAVSRYVTEYTGCPPSSRLNATTILPSGLAMSTVPEVAQPEARAITTRAAIQILFIEKLFEFLLFFQSFQPDSFQRYETVVSQFCYADIAAYTPEHYPYSRLYVLPDGLHDP